MPRHLSSQLSGDTKTQVTQITQAWNACDSEIRRLLSPFTDFSSVCIGAQPYAEPNDYRRANRACGLFRDEILRLCPESRNRELAEQYVQLARLKISEVINMQGSYPANWPGEIEQSILIDLLNARCFAVAALTPLLPEEISSWQ